MEKVLDRQAIENIKKELLAQRQQVVKDLGGLARRDDHEADERSAKFPEYGDKPDENAQEITDYSTNLMAEKVLEKSLADIDKALSRIEDGTYGNCKYCGNPIAAKRLQARPTANSCVSCKTELQDNA